MSQTTQLLPPDTVLSKYPSMTTISKLGRLAVKLARESFFGPEIMEKCTVFGCTDKPPLPRDKLDD